MRTFLEWLVQQRSGVAIGIAVLFFAVRLILRYGFDMWWPFGIVMATILGLVGLLAGKGE